MPLFFLLLLVMVAALYWRRSLLRRREQYIDSFQYAKVLDRRLAARRPELNAAQRRLVLDGLREYFQICRQAKRRLVAMPSQVVDDAWHEFILFTRQYQQFCQRALGRYLHHTPAEAMRTPVDAQDAIKRAWRLACQREGIDPRAPRALPKLFALDARLGIAGGFVYRLDCLAAAQTSASSGISYCAGHIGCGGGCTGGGGSSDGDSSSGGDGGCGGGCGGGGGD